MESKPEYPSRKEHRLKGYDYGTKGVYFVTICAKDRAPLFSGIAVGTTIGRPPEIVLTAVGKLVESAILQIPSRYDGAEVDQYVIMPNHVHLLLRLTAESGPTLGRIIQQMKGFVSKQAGRPVWQEKYYDHVIRDESDFLVKYKYICDNPAKWAEDEYYSGS